MYNFKVHTWGGVNLMLIKNANSKALRHLWRELACDMTAAAQEQHWTLLVLAGAPEPLDNRSFQSLPVLVRGIFHNDDPVVDISTSA